MTTCKKHLHYINSFAIHCQCVQMVSDLNDRVRPCNIKADQLVRYFSVHMHWGRVLGFVIHPRNNHMLSLLATRQDNVDICSLTSGEMEEILLGKAKKL